MGKLAKQRRAARERPRVAASAHDGASLTSQQLASWLPSLGSADADLLPDLPALVSRSRDLTRNNGIASGAIQTIKDNVVGGGLRLCSTPDWRLLGRDKQWAEEWSNQVEAKWRSWADTTDCDAAASLNFAGLTGLMLRSELMNGEGVALPLWLPAPGCRYSTRLQVIESDRLSNPHSRMDSASLRGGVEINGHGRPTAYWIRKTHPGDVFMGTGLVGEWERVPACTPWGRRRVIHLHDKERTGQSRGKPIFSAVMQQFKMLDRYSGAELDAAVANAMIAAFIETPAEMADLMELLGDNAEDKLAARMKQLGRVKMKTASIVPLFPGEKLSAFNPGRPNSGFEGFVNAVLRYVSAGLNLPYELLMKDFTRTNYSSARAALLEAWRYFKGKRDWMSTYWATPVFQLWLEEAVNAGEIEAPDFYENRYAYTRCRWIGAGRGWVDPVKEAKAAQLRLDTGLSTLEAECAEQGLDWEEVLEQRARERERMRELGLLDAASVSHALPIPPPEPDPEASGHDADNPAPA